MICDIGLVRPGRPEDAGRIDQVFRSSWEVAYRGILPEPQLRRFLDRRGPAWWRGMLADRDGCLVIEVNGEVAGYTTFGHARAAAAYRSEIYELYLDPLYQGLGLGEQLFESARQRLDARGLCGLLVWALAENAAACDFYRRRGGREVRRAFERFGHRLVPKIAFGWM